MQLQLWIPTTTTISLVFKFDQTTLNIYKEPPLFSPRAAPISNYSRFLHTVSALPCKSRVN